MARVWIPLPDTDFDTTEVAVPWHVLRRLGHEVVFATEHGGKPPACDPLLLRGVLFGQLGAELEPKQLYAEMLNEGSFLAPVSWRALNVEDFDGLILPGGHAAGMRQYLGSTELQAQVAKFWNLPNSKGDPKGRPVGAICHGVLVLARSKDASGKSVIASSRTTCLPKYMERSAYFLTAWKLGTYYRTYPAYVEEEVRAALESESQFEVGPRVLMTRGTDTDDRETFIVDDGRYVSARWPGDAYRFAKVFAAKLKDTSKGTNA